MSHCSVDFDYLPVLNLAALHQQVPPARDLVITNNSPVLLQQSTVTLTTQPAFLQPVQWQAPDIAPGEQYRISTPDLIPAADFFHNIGEPVTGSYMLTIEQNGQVLCTAQFAVQLLPFNHWNGITALPALLTAFVTPGAPEVSNILRKTAALLQKKTGNAALDGYRSQDPDRVRQQMAAIYEVIAGLQITYCSLPTGFETQGQKLRLPGDILLHKMGNSLDLTLLYAACLEAAGIHPLLVILHGHALAGAWLIPQTFPDAVNDDASLLTKRTAPGVHTIALLETTCMNWGHQVSFDEAAESARQKLLQQDSFVLFADVQRARFSGIRPLPARVRTAAGGWEPVADTAPGNNTGGAAGTLYTGQHPVTAEKPIFSKQQRWERRLLDLSLRNNLLNLRPTKSVVQLAGAKSAALENALSAGQELLLLPRPQEWGPVKEPGLLLSAPAAVTSLARHEFPQAKLRTFAPETELQQQLTGLYRASRLSLEENGANTLYMAIGLLKWYETDQGSIARLAPVLLVPVELLRRPAHKGFTIRSREEETLLNVTLLEMLRQDFGITISGLEQLPRDESGVDVPAIFAVIRQAILGRPRWEVEDQSVLSVFSFNKFILWNDIHYNAGQLLQHKVVQSLISGKMEWASLPGSADPADDAVHPQGVALPISTDSSQLRAILEAARGQNFVLHGPPGTGKSQTITNIIANALYQNKRVLFVAAKKAALDVVEARLDAIGLGPFCLELHSNKTKKTAVLQQLKQTIEITRRLPPEQFSAQAEKLYTLRGELNDYVTALHRPYPFGYSLYDLLGRYRQLAGRYTTSLRIPFTAIEQLDQEAVTTQEERIGELVALAGVATPYRHPLAALQPAHYTPQLKEQATVLLQQYLALLPAYRDLLQQATAALHIPQPVTGKQQAAALRDVITLLLGLPDVPGTLFGAGQLATAAQTIAAAAQQGKQRNLLRSRLLEQFDADILQYDATTAKKAWNLAAGTWFLQRWLQQRKIRRALAAFSPSGDLDKEQVPDVLNNLMACQAAQQQLADSITARELLGFLWREGEADWEALVLTTDTISFLSRQLLPVMDAGQVTRWRQQLATQFTEGSHRFLEQYRPLLEQLNDRFVAIVACEHELGQLLSVDFSRLPDKTADWTENAALHATQWLRHLDLLKDWAAYTQVRHRAVEAGLQPLVTLYEQGGVNSSELLVQYRLALYRAAADYIIHKEAALAGFNGRLFGEKINRFRTLSRQFEQLTREELFARLAARVPLSAQEAAQTSEMGILQKAIRNNGRAMPIRKLFDQLPHLLPRLAPCMLMSPISVAQYFDLATEHFDLVIFDEASQLPTCEAVSAIARASNVIVVGDPKQMPPTNFFSTYTPDEEQPEHEDLESILDDCLALSMPAQHLLWHYRSRHESLIAFSNARYYDNSLLTFPSADDRQSRVTFVPVEGYYDKGSSRQNRAEAKAIVAEVLQRLANPQDTASMGIVAFSVAQQTLIEDLMAEAFALQPELEKRAYERTEPLFIKNLENVQGDERDVILFSVGYGPDRNGQVSLNFGPVNREGGWRRLNVAVSRARTEMKVFSTLRAEQIDLNRTASEGVAGLKAFLAYAAGGRVALPVPAGGQAVPSAGFEQAIAEALRQAGYTVQTNIGTSSYKMDIGVVDPANPDRYLLGIRCDGQHYLQAGTSRDREIVQPDVLAGLGWQLHQVWAVDWWENPERTLQEIVEAIESARPKTIPVQAPAPAPVNPYPPTTARPGETLADFAMHRLAEALVNQAAQPYEIARLKAQPASSADTFLLAANKATIVGQLKTVIAAEAPISRNLLARRVLLAWNITRSGTRLNAYLDSLLAFVPVRQVTHGEQVFIWKEGEQPSRYPVFRVAHSEQQRRDPADLPPEELANAVKHVLRHQVSLPRESLVKETARAMGYTRPGTALEAVIEQAIDAVVRQGFAGVKDDRVVYTG